MIHIDERNSAAASMNPDDSDLTIDSHRDRIEADPLSVTGRLPLRERLRQETRAAHEALDARFEGMFTDEHPDLYSTFLAMNRTAHETIEPILAASELASLGWAPGIRLDALRDDCRALGLADPEPEPFFDAEPALPEAFGIAYVLEGSRLGAKFMLRAISVQPASITSSGAGLRYLQASSDPTPFRDLLASMTQWNASPADDSRAVQAADRTFRFFLDLALRIENQRTTDA